MIRMLVSARDAAEARDAALAGADFIDLKEPGAGALGAVDLGVIREAVEVLRSIAPRAMISATIGDLPANKVVAILDAVERVRQCGVDLVKVGLPGGGGADCEVLLTQLACCGAPVVPVLLVDDGLEPTLFAYACTLGFAAVMVDTEGKLAGSIFERVGSRVLSEAAAHARILEVSFGIAGALGLSDIAAIAQLRPAFAGFRSAVCAGSRSGRLDPARVRGLRERLAAASADLETVSK